MRTMRATALGGAAVAAAAIGTVGLAPTVGASAPPQVVAVASGVHTRLSTHDVSAGWTTFQVTEAASSRKGGLAQVFRLRPGVTLQKLQDDLVAAGSTNSGAFTTAVSRDTTLVGGTFVAPGATGTFADDLVPGTYYVANVQRAPSTLTSDAQVLVVHDTAPVGHAPATGGTVVMKDMRFLPSRSLPAAGTIKVKSSAANDADDIHFLLLLPVQDGTTDSDIQAFFDSGSHSEPPFLRDGPSAYTALLSPGTFEDWSYDLTPGTYALFCFITDPDTGIEHAAEGMHRVVTLS